jgi:actin related protein 2/3 complex subunit 2|mmetsp:Transcript_7989/g.9916  ORF Transcript_7989/g.9916 Transcript_7989/m.9916 type:complete len:301 (-) Transcript_7989:88-990(-)
MILLEFNNRILFEIIEQRFANPKRELLDILFADFDGVSFHVSTQDPEKKNLVTVSMGWSCCSQLFNLGARQDLQKIYGPMLQATAEDKYDVSLLVDLDNPPEDPKNLPLKISNLKRHVFAAPFKKVFGSIVNKNASNDIVTIDYRGSESIYLKPEGESCTVIFSISFLDDADAVFAKVFLQEFADARKSMRGVPSVKFTYKEAPMELENYPGLKNVDSNGFVSMVLFEQHLSPKNVYKTINLLETFRNYLHYHIKCSKAYMHNRMRSRVAKWLQVLNRARPDPIAEKAKKVASGRTFVRK